jgi:hypothetical protein
MAGMQYGSCLSVCFTVSIVEIHLSQVIDGIQMHTSEVKLLKPINRRAHRRLFHDQFNPTAVLRFRPQTIEASHMFLQLLLDAPEDFVSHIRQ